MKSGKQGRLAVILPLMSLFVSAGTVSHQYYRRAKLTQELIATEREFAQLQARLPPGYAVEPHNLHDHEHGERAD